MVPELEKAQVTELQVRMDCNGCVHKIKRAIHSIDGVYDCYVDFAQQKVTVVGRVGPERILKAIKKTRKIATICSHTDPGEQPKPETETPPTEPAANPPPTEAPPAEAPPAAPEPEPVKANPEPEVKPEPEAKDAAAQAETKDVAEVHMVHYYPHSSYVYKDHWNNYYPPIGHEIRYEAPYYVTHSYSSHKPKTYVSGYGNWRSPSRYLHYSGGEEFADDYHHRRASNADNITCMFSDENPNACRIA